MTNSKLDFWIQKNYNVLLRGKHGCGKTAQIIDAFDRNNLRWLYFSAATLDPWVDFVGIPKEKTDENGVNYIDLVRPKQFAYDEVDAIFFDEFNRAPKKVRNAVMELIQFKSINGKKFNNLKIIWAAINPDDEDDKEEQKYDVEVLDPAQKDRFHVIVDVPYKPSSSYFTKTYGENVSAAAISWWNGLEAKLKDEISPRRLDYAINMYVDGGDLRDVLPSKANVTKLISEIKEGPIKSRFIKAVKNLDKDQELFSDLVKKEFSYIKKNILSLPEPAFTTALKLLPTEHLASIVPEKKVRNVLEQNFNHFEELVTNISKTGNGKPSRICKRIINDLQKASRAGKTSTSVTGAKGFADFNVRHVSGRVYISSKNTIKLKPIDLPTLNRIGKVWWDKHQHGLAPINIPKTAASNTYERGLQFEQLFTFVYVKTNGFTTNPGLNDIENANACALLTRIFCRTNARDIAFNSGRQLAGFMGLLTFLYTYNAEFIKTNTLSLYTPTGIYVNPNRTIVPDFIQGIVDL